MPKVLNITPSTGLPGSAGKRRQAQALTSSSESDEDIDVASPSSCSDYENITSPSSSTCSGPIYVRTPGFQHHAHHISRPKYKKKRTILADVQPQQSMQKHPQLKDSFMQKKTSVPQYVRDRAPVMRAVKNPLPMRLRALPQSFWQQPNKPAALSSGPLFAPLPPLASTKEEDIRPVSPSSDPESVTETTVATDRNGNNILRHKGAPQPQERKITVGNTDLLLKLFENVEKREKNKSAVSFQRNQNSIRRRPTKVVPISNASILTGEDPHMVSGLSEQLFPQLSLEHSQKYQNEHTSLHLVTLNAGDRAITLPSLTVEQNYSQMLSELVMHI